MRACVCVFVCGVCLHMCVVCVGYASGEDVFVCVCVGVRRCACARVCVDNRAHNQTVYTNTAHTLTVEVTRPQLKP